jgi:hypothetical protein
LKTENIKRIYNKHLTIVTQNGKKETTEGRMWFDSPFRKSATDVGFEPADPINTKKYYNLWQGFAYTAWDGLRNGKQKADCNLFKNMVRDVIANKNKEVYEYVMNWLAYMFQNVGKRRPGVALSLLGGQRIGKGFFANTIGELLGVHYIPVLKGESVTGKFNRIVEKAVLVFIDEAVTKEMFTKSGVMKGTLTESYHLIEPKGIDAFHVSNHIWMIIATNKPIAVSVEHDDQRYAIFRCSEVHKQDKEYFSAIKDQLKNGGYRVLLHELMNRDLSKVDINNIPLTESKYEHKLATGGIVALYAEELFEKGSNFYSDPHRLRGDTLFKLDYVKKRCNGYENEIPKELIIPDFKNWAEDNNRELELKKVLEHQSARFWKPYNDWMPIKKSKAKRKETSKDSGIDKELIRDKVKAKGTIHLYVRFEYDNISDARKWFSNHFGKMDKWNPIKKTKTKKRRQKKK